jgi:hypothetical protein
MGRLPAAFKRLAARIRLIAKVKSGLPKISGLTN